MGSDWTPSRRDLMSGSAALWSAQKLLRDMKTHYGVCPSFTYSSPLPLFWNAIRRSKRFEVFAAQGTQTGEESQLTSEGLPVVDGRWHGVRLFSGEGETPNIPDGQFSSLKVKQTASGLAVAYAQSWNGSEAVPLGQSFKGWHLPSLNALAYTHPVVLRTLDYSYQARKEKRPDWSKPRVLPTALLQGEEMAVELQCQLANTLKCALWFNAPPRFELSESDYEVRLEEYLQAIKITANKPPILEYGNELWNDGFPVKNWLDTAWTGSTWQKAAANEIICLKRVADRVFGEPGPLGAKPYYLFVGGHIGNPDTLDKILAALPFAPDIAGPAIYAQPLKRDQDLWKMATAPIPQSELRASAMANMPSFSLKLEAHRNILKAHNVPFFACYEVGQDMHAHGEAYKAAALQAQREEWIGDAYRELRRMLNAAGVNLACWYSCASVQTPDRAFGLLEGTLDRAQPLPKAIAARGD